MHIHFCVIEDPHVHTLRNAHTHDKHNKNLPTSLCILMNSWGSPLAQGGRITSFNWIPLCFVPAEEKNKRMNT